MYTEDDVQHDQQLAPCGYDAVLGQRLENTIVDILELLFSIPSSQTKITVLKQMSIKLDLLKVLLRLAKDTMSISTNKYMELQTILQEIGKMLGGWMKATKQTEQTT